MASCPPSSSEPNSESWPSASCFLTSTTESIARSCCSISPRREWPRESKAPALISDSMVRLLQTGRSTLARKSLKEVKRPLALRVAMIEETTFSPTLRIAPRPKRMSVPTGVNWCSESLTSGGSTLMPIRRHSAR